MAADRQARQAPRLAVRPVPAEFQVPTGAQMRDLGRRLAGLLRPGDLVVLTGPLGAGKTTLVQGIGQGLGVRGPVTSPTFVIARVHPSLHGGPALVHADAYRLGSRAEVDDLDLDGDLDSSVTVVEWGEGLVEDLSPSHLEIRITMARRARAQGMRNTTAAPGTNGAEVAESVRGPGKPDVPGRLDVAGQPDVPDELDVPDEPRTVQLIGTGPRWAAAAACLTGFHDRVTSGGPGGR